MLFVFHILDYITMGRKRRHLFNDNVIRVARTMMGTSFLDGADSDRSFSMLAFVFIGSVSVSSWFSSAALLAVSRADVLTLLYRLTWSTLGSCWLDRLLVLLFCWLGQPKGERWGTRYARSCVG